eukprot:Rmarinus@m.19300
MLCAMTAFLTLLVVVVCHHAISVAAYEGLVESESVLVDAIDITNFDFIRGVDEMSWDQWNEDFHLSLIYNQWPSDSCDKTKLLVVRMGGDKDQSPCRYQGLWGKVARVGAALSFALATRRTLVMAENDTWINVDPKECPTESWGCYFQPLSRCSEPVVDYYPVDKRVLGVEEDIRVVHWSACMHHNIRHGAKLPADHNLNRFFLSGLDDTFSSRSREWVQANVMRHVVLPRKDWLVDFDRVRDDLNWTHPVISVHYRRGDKYRNQTEEIPIFLDYYLPAILKLRKEIVSQTHGKNLVDCITVFVASESPQIPALLDNLNMLSLGRSVDGIAPDSLGESKIFGESFEAAIKSTRVDGLRFIYVADTPRQYPPPWDLVRSMRFDRSNEAFYNLLDLWLLSQGDHFVGTSTSTVSHVALDLMRARKGKAWNRVLHTWPKWPTMNHF